MPSGAGHFTGSSKRVEAFSKSSNLVVNSVALSRDLPVFPGFFEIIRVVNGKILFLLHHQSSCFLHIFILCPTYVVLLLFKNLCERYFFQCPL